MTKPKYLLLIAAWFVPGICGCGPELPETVHVTGKVVHDGKPITNAQIGFVPMTEGSGALPARGETDESGEFTLKTFVTATAEADGATPGAYVVTVQKTDVPADPAKMAAMFSKNPGYVPPQLLPSEYADVGKSPLKATVTEDGDNSFDFELEGDVKPSTK